MLNERQKKILNDSGISTNYDELTVTQKMAIVAIENMLCYLEDQYEMEFNYVGYVEADASEPEHLLATVADGSVAGTVIVHREYDNEGYLYDDNMLSLMANPIYQAEMQELMYKYFERSNVFSSVENAYCEVTEENVFANTSGSTCVFINAADYTEEKLDIIVHQFADEIIKELNGNSCTVDFFLTKESELSKIYSFNYKQKILEDIFVCQKTCSISVSGNINIY